MFFNCTPNWVTISSIWNLSIKLQERTQTKIMRNHYFVRKKVVGTLMNLVFILESNIALLHPGLLCYIRTQFSRALLLMWFSACTKIAKTNMSIILFIQNPHYLRYFSLLLNTVYWWLYSVIKKHMLGKVKNPEILSFSLLPKEPS